MDTISFVIPCYRSEHTIEKVVEEIRSTVSQRPQYDYEIITVNDCSPDQVYDVLKRLATEDHKVKVINFAKNMGKHAAVIAGYAVVTGAFVVNLDDDCQCPVDQLWSLMELVEADICDIATAEYYQKRESFIKRLGSNVNFAMSEILLDKPKGLRMENFNVMKAFVAKEIINYKNPYPYIEGLIFRVTRRVKTVKMDERERGDENSSGFTLAKSFSLLMNGLTAFSVKPLRIASICGVLFAALGFLYGTITILRKLLNPNILMGYSSLLAVVLFSSGLIMIMLGLIGEYLGRIYICINDSPQYVIRNTINIGERKRDNHADY